MEAVAQEAGSLDLVKKQQDNCPTLSQSKSLLVSKASPSGKVNDMERRLSVKEWPNLGVWEDNIRAVVLRTMAKHR